MDFLQFATCFLDLDQHPARAPRQGLAGGSEDDAAAGTLVQRRPR